MATSSHVTEKYRENRPYALTLSTNAQICIHLALVFPMNSRFLTLGEGALLIWYHVHNVYTTFKEMIKLHYYKMETSKSVEGEEFCFKFF